MDNTYIYIYISFTDRYYIIVVHVSAIMKKILNKYYSRCVVLLISIIFVYSYEL